MLWIAIILIALGVMLVISAFVTPSRRSIRNDLRRAVRRIEKRKPPFSANGHKDEQGKK